MSEINKMQLAGKDGKVYRQPTCHISKYQSNLNKLRQIN